MNELSLNIKTLAKLHTGLAECFEGYKIPSMNFSAQAISDVSQNLDIAAKTIKSGSH